tara:strand:+ start:54 stop:458 length:405 start_codon:yes stop_codon:yes gene_type:complete
MFSSKKEGNDLIKVAALLIHAAKIDENYSIKEEKIINKALIEMGADSHDIDLIIENAKKLEDNSNQILEFTKEVKNMNIENKIQILKTLWRIIYSNNEVDIYETSLMRRLAGLLYIDNKIMGDIKEEIKNENSQ